MQLHLTQKLRKSEIFLEKGNKNPTQRTVKNRSPSVLMCLYSEKPSELVTDASDRYLVIFFFKKVETFRSLTLSDAENKYMSLKKEAMRLFFALKKFLVQT